MQKDKRYLSTFGFIDLLFNMLVGFVFLFFIAYILINPIADKGKVDPPDIAMIVVDWPNDSKLDIDIWIKDPMGNVLSFTNKTRPGMHLEKDDLGAGSDSFQGKLIYNKNQEVVHLTNLFPGQYTMTLHLYAVHGDKGNLPQDAKVKFMTIKRYALLGDKTISMGAKGQEAGVMAFWVDEEQRIVKIDWDHQGRIVNRNVVNSLQSGTGTEFDTWNIQTSENAKVR